MAKVSRAIAYAQSRGVSHQDISPRNIIIDNHGEPVLIDFGLAKLGNLWSDASGAPGGGTPAYMAPEQARQDAGRVEALADVFSLGAVLHFLLAGRSPYRSEPGKALEAARSGKMEIAAMDQTHPALRELVRKCLATNPADRFASASALAEALEPPVKPKRSNAILALGALSIAAILAMVIGLSNFTPEPKTLPLFPAETQDILQVTSFADATDALPLRDNDRIHIEVRVAHGADVAAYWIAGGVVKEMPIEITAGEQIDTVSAPGVGKDVPLSSPRGSEAVVIIASHGKLDRDKARGAIEEGLRKTPIGSLPPDTLVRIGMTGMNHRAAKGVENRPIDLTRTRELPWFSAAAGLEAICKSLKESKQIDFYAGCVFPTRGPK
jgi:hypothetical protein